MGDTEAVVVFGCMILYQLNLNTEIVCISTFVTNNCYLLARPRAVGPKVSSIGSAGCMDVCVCVCVCVWSGFVYLCCVISKIYILTKCTHKNKSEFEVFGINQDCLLLNTFIYL